MNPTMKDLGIDRFTPEQRLSLALEIWESLNEEQRVSPLTSAQLDEVHRRDAELARNPGSALTWEQIRSDVEFRK